MGMAGGWSTTSYGGANGKQYARIDKAYVLLVAPAFPRSPAVSAGATGTAGRAPEACWTCTRPTPSGWTTPGCDADHVPGGATHARQLGAGDLTGLRLVGKAAGCVPALTS